MTEDFTVLFLETMDDQVDITKLGESFAIGLHITISQKKKETALDLQSELRIFDLASSSTVGQMASECRPAGSYALCIGCP